LARIIPLTNKLKVSLSSVRPSYASKRRSNRALILRRGYIGSIIDLMAGLTLKIAILYLSLLKIALTNSTSRCHMATSVPQ